MYNETGGLPYQLIRRAGGPLTITNSPTSLSLATGQPPADPGKNYYEESITGNSAIITNQTTRQQYVGALGYCYETSEFCNGEVVGTIVASFDSAIPTGTYDLDVRKANGRQARAAAPLTVSRGLPFV